MSVNIIPARKEDARFLADVVMGAIGKEICIDMAGDKERLPLVKELFTRLASQDDSQYSYRNAFIALSPHGKRLGGVIAYDGALLHHLRKAFIKAANSILKWNITVDEEFSWGDETEPGEIYVDSLFVLPEARKAGIGKALLEKVIENYSSQPKPIGLLTEPSNYNAHSLYKKLGFIQVGTNGFFGFPMLHMQKLT